MSNLINLRYFCKTTQKKNKGKQRKIEENFLYFVVGSGQFSPILSNVCRIGKNFNL